MSISGHLKPSALGVVKIAFACAAVVLLLWGLGHPYLWQDEAATAVLAQRLLRFGKPLAYDGVNLITVDHSAAENSNNIDQRTRDPQSAIDFYIERGDFKHDTAWKWQPWGQFLVAALSFRFLAQQPLQRGFHLQSQASSRCCCFSISRLSISKILNWQWWHQAFSC